jgi:ABC-type Na+ transport system ATPase subunit NatA
VEVCDRIVALNKGEIVKDIQTSTETTGVRDVFRGLNFHIKKEMYFTSHYTKRF